MFNIYYIPKEEKWKDTDVLSLAGENLKRWASVKWFFGCDKWFFGCNIHDVNYPPET